VGFADMVSDSFDRTVRGQIQEMKPDWSVAATRNPYREQLDKLLDARELAPAKIEKYLASSRRGPLLLASGSVGTTSALESAYGRPRLGRPFSPNVGEGEFSDVRTYGVL